MKLQKKINRYFFRASLVLFLVSGVGSYFVIKYLVNEEVDETLEAEANNLITELKTKSTLDSLFVGHSYRLEIYPAGAGQNYKSVLCDTLIYVGEEGEGVPFRQIKTTERIKGKKYLIILRRSLIEREDLITGIGVLLVGVFFLIFLVLNLINIYSEKKWWQPFNETLKNLSDFDLNSGRKIETETTDIDEFNELNKSLEKMSEKLIADYKNLKEFSENASHEMQTPLAVIRSKLDLMIQNKSLTSEQYDQINSIYSAVKRLVKLNHSLNLLTKIENREFTETEEVNISALIEENLNGLREIIQSKNLELKTEIKENIIIKINRFAAETLISNLLMNAVQHNIEWGKISITLSAKEFVVKNTGKKPAVPVEELFKRLKKGSRSTDSPGLGLSIVKEICKLNNFNIYYSYEENLHILKITFI